MTVFDWADIAPSRIPYLDNCPLRCEGYLNAPISPVRQYGPHPDGVRADYICWKCGHRWFTGWLREDPNPERSPT